MIFKDAYAANDKLTSPINRFKLCLNCKDPWDYHYNWLCHGHSYPFNGLSSVNTNDYASYNGYWPQNPLQIWAKSHYITKSMLSSIGLNDINDYYNYFFNMYYNSQPIPNTTTSTSKKLTNEFLPDWKLSRALSIKSGECPCGISRQWCSYHK